MVMTTEHPKGLFYISFEYNLYIVKWEYNYKSPTIEPNGDYFQKLKITLSVFLGEYTTLLEREELKDTWSIGSW